jgi:hypothetical protein
MGSNGSVPNVGDITEIVRLHDSVPNEPGRTFTVLGVHSLNVFGEVAFLAATDNAAMKDEEIGVWHWSGNVLFEVVGDNDAPPPGTPQELEYTLIRGPTMFDDGRVVYAARLEPGAPGGAGSNIV